MLRVVQHPVTKILFMTLSFCFANTALALPEDKNQPVHITADSGSLNRNTGVTVFNGHVLLTQGSSTLKASKLTVYTDSQNQLIKAIAESKPAVYTTLTDPQKPLLTATALNIQYLPQVAKIILTGNASVIQEPNSYKAPVIQYDINQQTVVSPASAEGRTTIIIQPQSIKSRSRAP